MVTSLNCLKVMFSLYLNLIGGILSASFSVTFSGFTPSGTTIFSRRSDCMNSAKVFLLIFLPASYSLRTTQ